MKITVAVMLATFTVATVAAAQGVAPDSAGTARLRLAIPLIDVPYNVANGLRGPSMAQSLGVTTALYELAHTDLQRAWGGHRWLANLSITLWDVVSQGFPFGDAWLHEEFHRAVLGNRGIDSFDDIYSFNLSSRAVAVSHVKDGDLVRLKAMHPADQIRLGAAGIEGENLLISGLERNRFVYGSKANNVPLYWLMKLGAALYVASGPTSSTDSLTDRTNARDGANVGIRDFIGHDFTAWTYDLHRPGEPYDARGVHPSGVGIDRYIKNSDLSSDERAYLKHEGVLQLTNFLDLNLIGIDGIVVRSPWNGQPIKLGVSGSHYLTSFGHTVDINLLVKQNETIMLFVLHRYKNAVRGFPGVDAQLLDFPVVIAGRHVALSPRATMWLQPQDQLFQSHLGRPGVRVSLEGHDLTSSRFGRFVEIEAKTEGWVAGNVQLGSSFSIRLGSSMAIP